MARGRTLAVALGVAVMLAAIVLITARSRDASETPTGGTQIAANTPAAAPSGAAMTATQRDAGTSAVARVLRATDAHDRDLLAAIERQTKASPPKAIYDLIELRRSGATRDELQRFMDRELAGRLPLRVAAGRWLRAVLPRPGLDGQPAQPPPMGSGGGRKLLGPIDPARAR
jgi:hypothetical protein